MILLYYGLPGSGKTANAVRDIFLNENQRLTYSNIITKKLKNNKVITPAMIVEKTPLRVKKDGTQVYDLTLNLEYWKSIKEPINVVIDEAHTLLNPRRAMSKVNVILTDWMALIRRVLGTSTAGYGNLILITQLERRIDPIAREMATQIKYHVCHWTKTCETCGGYWQEHSEQPEHLFRCPGCNSIKLKKHSHVVEVWCFAGISKYEMWKEFGEKSYYKHYTVNDIETVFPLYNTLQWDNLLSELY